MITAEKYYRRHNITFRRTGPADGKYRDTDFKRSAEWIMTFPNGDEWFTNRTYKDVHDLIMFLRKNYPEKLVGMNIT